MAFTFNIVSPKIVKLDETISTSANWSYTSTEENVGYFSRYVYKPDGTFTTTKPKTYSSGKSGYTVSDETIMSEPGKWKIVYQCVYYANANDSTGSFKTVQEIIDVIDPNAPKPKVEITPRLATIKSGEKVTFRVDLKDATPNHLIANVKWYIAGKTYDGLTSRTMTVGAPELGTHKVSVDVTVDDAIQTFIVSDETSVTVVKGVMPDVRIMVNSSTPDVEFGSGYAFSSQVTGAPDDATITYEWYVNGVLKGKEKDFSEVVESLPMERNVYLVASIVSPSYEGVTFQSPTTKVIVKPARWTPEVRINGQYMTRRTWVTGLGENYGVYIPNIDIRYYNVVTSYDDQPMLNDMIIRAPFDINKVGQRVNIKMTGEVEGRLNGVVVYERSPFVKEVSSLVNKDDPYDIASEFAVPVKMRVNEVDYIINSRTRPVVNIEGKTNEVINIPISIDFTYVYPYSNGIANEPTNVGIANYETYFGSGIVEVLDFQDQVVGTVENGFASITLPAEAKDIVGKIRLRVPAGNYATAEKVLYMDLKVRVYPNPLLPVPIIDMSFQPDPCVLDGKYNAIVSATPLPEGTKIFTKFDSDVDYTEIDRKEYTALTMDPRLHKADVKITSTGFDDYLYTIQKEINTVGKSWPDLSLDLVPSKINLTVGESLFIDATMTDISGILDDPETTVSVQWFKDDSAIPSDFLTRNYDLNWIVNTVGVHTFKCVVTLHNIKYETGHKLVENSVQITTEKRKMAITVSINPATGNIKFGESQKLTAVVEGAPVDATLDYVWKVDGAPVTADAGSNGLSITIQGDAVGTKLASLTVTATAEGSEPATEGATANVVISKADQTAFTATLTVTPEEGEVGDTFNAKIDVSNTMSGATISYKWATGETTPSIDYVADAAGKTTLKCDVTSTLANYVDLKVSRSKTITISDVTPIEVDGFYIWPLPHIDAAFMYGSWWALDEIQALTVEGKDWKTETVFTYQKEVDTFKKILADYNIVMVQESRNGRIIDRQKLESGLIY